MYDTHLQSVTSITRKLLAKTTNQSVLTGTDYGESQLPYFWFLPSSAVQNGAINSETTAGLHPQSPRHFAWQPSKRFSQTLRPSYLSHVFAAAMSAAEYRHLHQYDCRTRLTYAHCPELWHQPRLATVTCAWRRRLCGITPAVHIPALSWKGGQPPTEMSMTGGAVRNHWNTVIEMPAQLVRVDFSPCTRNSSTHQLYWHLQLTTRYTIY